MVSLMDPSCDNPTYVLARTEIPDTCNSLCIADNANDLSKRDSSGYLSDNQSKLHRIEKGNSVDILELMK